ncbi:MAG: hypothetical protein ACYDAC_07265 [Candidatus Dormibacteria bacterium]
MARSTVVMAAGVVVFAFDADPATAPSRALRVLTVRKALPRTEVGPRERVSEASARLAAAAGAELHGRRGRGERLHLVSLEDEPSRGTRTVTAWYYATATLSEPGGGAAWAATGRSLRLSAGDTAALRQATERLRQDTRHASGAAALLGDVFTGDDLLRVNLALQGGPEGSERTFRRRIQELRDAGVLRPVAEREVAALRLRVLRFRSPLGTGGRPPELFRYAGSGGDEEQLVGLRARRTA